MLPSARFLFDTIEMLCNLLLPLSRVRLHAVRLDGYECIQQVLIYYLPIVMLNVQPNFADLVRCFHPYQPEESRYSTLCLL